MEMLSFVIPCYRSALTITNVVDKIIETVTNDGRYDYEIICVNDCSPDNTIDVLNGIADRNEKVIVLDLARNFGQHSAIMAGLNYVSGDIIVCLDDDGQTPPEECFKLVDKINEGYDLVSAKYPKKKESLFRRFGAWTAAKMAEKLINKPKGVEINSYYAVKRFVVDETIKYKNAYPYVQGLELRATRNITAVDVEHRAREIGKSNYTLSKLIALWMSGFTAFSEKPLRIASGTGALCAFGGFIFGVIIIIKKLLNPDVPIGYSSMMAVILFVSGFIMLMLGLIGEYIGKIYICINNAPQYVIRSARNVRPERSTEELRLASGNQADNNNGTA
ncbi:MAG: glycosyltransferase family 2 protein [Ruminococcus sp.]|nr:glycosyltransferase family 2 protein [Ruminococcus sp.]